MPIYFHMCDGKQDGILILIGFVVYCTVNFVTGMDLTCTTIVDSTVIGCWQDVAVPIFLELV